MPTSIPLRACTGLYHVVQSHFCRAAECRRDLAMRIMSVCPSVCSSVGPSVKRVQHCDETDEKSVQIFKPHERSFSLVYSEEEWLVGAIPLGQPAPVGAKSPILNRYSLIAPQP